MSEDNGAQYLRVWELDKVLAGDLKPLSEYRFGQSVPEGFVFSPDGRYLYGAATTPACPTSSAMKWPVARSKRFRMRSLFFRPVPLADGKLVGMTYTAAGFVPAIIEPQPLKDVSAITFLGAALAEKYPWSPLGRCRRRARSTTKAITAKERPYVPLRRLELSNAFRCCRLQKTVEQATMLTSKIRCSSRASG